MSRLNPYSKRADDLIKLSVDNSLTEKQVKIDYLTFTFKAADLRHCQRAGSVKVKVIKDFEVEAAEREYVYVNDCMWPKMPKIKPHVATGSQEDAMKALDKYRELEAEIKSQFYEDTLNVFVDFVLGFRLSKSKGVGFNGYTQSHDIYTKCGSKAGFLAIGGQADTVHFQISGQGCKHLFEYTTPFKLHHWLNTVIGLGVLNRIDLARDCYDNNFNCDYAVKCYEDTKGQAFRTGAGGRCPLKDPDNKSYYDADGKEVFIQEMFRVGMRSSAVSWRIYNKKLEQGIKDDNLTWYRSEVELKKWSVDTLLYPDAAFAGICEFSASMTNVVGVRTKLMTKAKNVALDVASRVKWVRHFCGKALGDILDFTDGDVYRALGLILPDDSGGKLGIPPTYKDLIKFNFVEET